MERVRNAQTDPPEQAACHQRSGDFRGLSSPTRAEQLAVSPGVRYFRAIPRYVYDVAPVLYKSGGDLRLRDRALAGDLRDLLREHLVFERVLPERLRPRDLLQVRRGRAADTPSHHSRSEHPAVIGHLAVSSDVQSEEPFIRHSAVCDPVHSPILVFVLHERRDQPPVRVQLGDQEVYSNGVAVHRVAGKRLAGLRDLPVHRDYRAAAFTAGYVRGEPKQHQAQEPDMQKHPESVRLVSQVQIRALHQGRAALLHRVE